MKYKTLLIALVFLSSCAVPRGIPTPTTFKSNVNGAKIYLYPKRSSAKKVEGEIIAVKDSRIYVLENEIKFVNSNYTLVHNLTIVDPKAIRSGHIVLARLADSQFKSADLIGLMTISHGWFAPITILLNIGGIRSVKKATYRMKIGRDVYWNEVHKFARFPQGLPPGIELDQLK